MAISYGIRGVWRCKCDRKECRHKWEAKSKPDRCAKCKYRSVWNSEDQRRADPFAGVAVASRIPAGMKAPQPPDVDVLLDSFRKARDILAEIVRDNPCDHKKKLCVCDAKASIEQIDEQIARLSGLAFLVKPPKRKRKSNAHKAA